MNRRKLLKSVAGGVTLGLAGCIARKSSTDATREDETTNTTEHSTDRENRTESGGSGTPPRNSEPTLVKKSFEVVSSGCGKKKIETNASFEGHTVQVTGTISGSNSCYTAELKNATLEQDTLTVMIRSFENKSNELCSMCLTNIEYNATCTFENGLPNRVVVVHNGTQVTSKTRT